MCIKTAILTISTRGSKGERREDTSGNVIKELVPQFGGSVVAYDVLPDVREQIVWQLRRLAEYVKVDLILTTGGTGLSPTDVTPEATLEVIERRAPGFEEAMRAACIQKTPHAMLSRAVAGILHKTLIINLPGSPKAVRENLEVILPALPHAVQILRGTDVPDDTHDLNHQ